MSLCQGRQPVDLARSGRLEEARNAFEEVLLEDPRNPDVLYNLGMCFTDLGQPDRAIVALSKSIEHTPKHSNSYVALGYAYSKTGDLENAKKYFMEALKLDPYNSYAMRNLGGLYGTLGDNHKALSYLEESYAINPSDPQTVYGLGHTHESLKDNEKADRYYREVLKADAPAQIKSLAKDGLRRIAESTFKSKGVRMDAVFYLLSALKLFKEKDDAGIRRIAFEIALKGQAGFEVNNPDKRYSLSTMPGDFTGLQMVCYMYAGFKRIDPTRDTGFDLSDEYAAAQQLFDSGESA